MKFADLKPGDEIIARRGRLHTCRAMVVEYRGDYVVAVFWNSPSARWNNSLVQIKPDQVAEYPEGR